MEKTKTVAVENKVDVNGGGRDFSLVVVRRMTYQARSLVFDFRGGGAARTRATMVMPLIRSTSTMLWQ